MGVWIETRCIEQQAKQRHVTPCMGVWIETRYCTRLSLRLKRSHPVWVCGLKLDVSQNRIQCIGVTPCMGVWIETL